MKSKPLSEITNRFNLTPSSTLKDLSKSTKPSIRKSPILRNSKPYNNHNFSTAALKQGSENKSPSDNRSSKSNTSIGSSDPIHNAVEFSTPLRPIAQPPTPPLGSGISGILYTRRKSDVEAKRGKDVSELEKSKEKTKSITRPTSRLVHVDKAIEKGNSVPSNRVEKIKDKGKAYDVLSSTTITMKNLMDKGKAIVEPSDDIPETSNRRRAIQSPINFLPQPKTVEKLKKDLPRLSSSSLPRPKNTRKRMNEAGESESPKSWTDPYYQKQKQKRSKGQESNSAFSSLPADFVEQQKAYWKEVDEFELSVEEISGDELDT